MISKINTSGLLKVVLAVFLALFSLSSYSNKPNQHSSVSEDHSVTDSINKNTSNDCLGTGNESCINQVRQNFTNTGKTILGETYLGDGRFGISFLDVQNMRNGIDNGTYEAAVSTDCNCNLTKVQVSLNCYTKLVANVLLK